MSFVKLTASSLAIAAVSATASYARDKIGIVGSSTVAPPTQAVAEQFANDTACLSSIVEWSGTGGGMQIFCQENGEGHPDLTDAARAMKPAPFLKSVQDNVAYGPKIHGLAKIRADLDGIVETSLRRAALWDEAKDRLETAGTGLSGGQQQSLTIARAVATQPDVLLMDEPCSARDPTATSHVEELIHDLRSNFSVVT